MSSKKIGNGRKFDSNTAYKKIKSVMNNATDTDIAKMLGLSQQAFSNQKQRGLAAQTLIDFHYLTGVSLDYLVEKQ